jgi:arylsulfatase A-like enzyme
MLPSRLFFLIFLLLILHSCQTDTTTPPNIILVITDDQGIGDLSIHGNEIIQTPHIDSMAMRSASLQRFYVSPVCAPTRASLMTGRYNYRTRVVDTWIGRAMMDTGEITVAELLRDAGYETGIFGKWHLGDCYPMRPMDQGFNESLVLKGGGLAQPSEPYANQRRYTDPILFKNGQEVQTKGYCTDVYFDAALNFITQSSRKQEPFFAYLPTNAPHGPYHDVPNDLKEKYLQMDLTSLMINPGQANEQRLDRLAAICAMIENVDQNVGKLFAHLEQLNIIENTLVVFMVDNGPNTMRYVMDLRGMKSNVHEGGIRSPFYAHWPAQLQPGLSSDKIAAHIDLLPTLLEVAGVTPPTSLRLDGKSVLPLLKGEEEGWTDRSLFIQTHRGDVPQAYHHFAAIEQTFKLVHPTGFNKEKVDPDTIPYELYNIENDPDESINLADSLSDEVTRIKDDYLAWFEDVSSTRPDNYAKPEILIGTPHETVTILTSQDWERTDGGGWGTHGFWKLSAAETAQFDIEVHLPEAVDGSVAHLDLGSRTLEKAFENGQTLLTFPAIEIEAGSFQLAAFVAQNEGFARQFQVFMRKK